MHNKCHIKKLSPVYGSRLRADVELLCVTGKRAALVNRVRGRDGAQACCDSAEAS